MKGLLAPVVLALAACSGQERESVNHPPFIADTSPAEGEIVTFGPGNDRDLMVNVGDEDLTDHLFMRFLVDYPTGNNPKQLLRQVEFPPTGMVVRSLVFSQPNCRDLGIGPGMHRLVFSAADRRFLDPTAGEAVDPDAPLDSVAEQGHRVRVVWLMNCP